MAKKKVDSDVRKALRAAQKLIRDGYKADGNEAETRRRVERLFSSLMGYDVFENITRELAVSAHGETEHCDFGIIVDPGPNAKPDIFVELKRVGLGLAGKHLRQVASYAINAGCEWIILTNGRQWQLHHVSFGQPPQTKLLASWDLLEDDLADLARGFELVSYKSVKRGGLDTLWQKANVLTKRNLLQVFLSEDSIKLARRELRKLTEVFVTPEDIVAAFRKLLNEAAGVEMSAIKISLPARKPRSRSKKKAEASHEETLSNEPQTVHATPAAPEEQETDSPPLKSEL
ncbi:type I restriction enzyme HsdR N-terminal domain-containing protein [bacterium]|nr:type I restriction enzyme HsdR N-terminal domain-containing protein [bacterium]